MSFTFSPAFSRQLLFFSVSIFDLGKNQKRWVVIGICLHRILLPVLRDFVAQEIPKHYTPLKSTRGIDTQVYGRHMTHDGASQLNYGSINNNWGNFKRKARSYDYKVGTAEDLAKLYLEPHMAKFTGNGIKTENVNFPYWSPWKHIFMHYASTGRTGLLFGITVNCLLMHTSMIKRSAIALSSCSQSCTQTVSFFFLEEEGGAESKGGAVGRALNCLLTTWPELLSRRQRLDVVLSLLLVLVFAMKGFSPATRSLSYPYIYLFIL